MQVKEIYIDTRKNQAIGDLPEKIQNQVFKYNSDLL